MKKISILSLLVLLAVGTASAQSFSDAADKAQADLEASLEEFAELQEAIADEKIPLSRELDELERRAISLRQQERDQRRLVDHEQYDLSEMQNRVSSLRDNNNYLSNLMRDYIRRFETRIHISEVQHYQDVISRATEIAEGDRDATSTERFDAQLAVIDAAFDRLGEVIGGKTFEGEAIAEDQTVKTGAFAQAGPFVFFHSDDERVIGEAVMQRGGGYNASIYEMDSGFHTGIRDLAREGEGVVPIDTTLGSARQLIATRDNLIEHIRKGGLVMIPILALFFVAAGIAIFKWLEIGGVRIARQDDLDVILSNLRKGEKDAAIRHARSVKGPAGEMLVAAVENADEDKEVIEEQLYEVIIRTQPKLERFLPFIAVVAATAPLLGLLGTVMGMIRTFRLITVFGTGDAQQLSAGISEALITTQFGLTVAIPMLIVHALLNRKAKGVVGSMEQTAVGFINGVTEHRNGNGDEEQS